MYTIQAIGMVHNERKAIQDDYWGCHLGDQAGRSMG